MLITYAKYWLKGDVCEVRGHCTPTLTGRSSLETIQSFCAHWELSRLRYKDTVWIRGGQ